MHKRRGSLGVAVIKHYLYAVGGQDMPSTSSSSNIRPIADVERYDVRTDQWTVLDAQLNQPREGVSCGVLGDTIYAVGGFDGKVRKSFINFSKKK